MKKLSVAPITNSAQFFPKKGTLEFLQLAFQEGFTAIVRALIGPAYDPAVVYVLYGCINSGTYPTYSITEGVVFYNGEIFYVDAAGFTSAGSDVAVFSIITTQYTTFADPVTLSDASSHNIHNIRKILISSGAIGSGIADYSAAFFMNFTIPAQLNLTAPSSGAYAGNQLQVIGAYPNLIGFVPPSSNLNPVLCAGSHNIGDITPSVFHEVTVTLPTTLADANYYVMGCIISQGTPVNDCVAVWTVRLRTATDFVLGLRELVSPTVVQNIAFEYIVFAK